MGRGGVKYLCLVGLVGLVASCDAFTPTRHIPPVGVGGSSFGSGGSGGGLFFGSSGGPMVDLPKATGGAMCDDPTDEGVRACQPDDRGAAFECVESDLPATCSGAPDYSLGLWAMGGQGGLGGEGGQGGEGSASFAPAPLGACPGNPDPGWCQFSYCVGRARLLPNDRVECCYLMGQHPCP